MDSFGYLIVIFSSCTRLIACIHLRRFRKLDPFVEVKCVAADFCGCYLFVDRCAVCRVFSDHDAFIQNGRPPADVQKRVWLLVGDDFMQPAAVFDLFLEIIFLPDLDNQFIGGFIFESRKV